MNFNLQPAHLTHSRWYSNGYGWCWTAMVRELWMPATQVTS